MIPIQKIDCVDSTNNLAMRRIDQGLTRPILLWAKKQTKGRGQAGKNFDSAEGGLYLTWVIPEPDPLPENLTLKLGRLFQKTLEPMLAKNDPRKLHVVPLNDLYLDAKKVAGILVERYKGHLILGFGMNVLPRSFPEELASIATTFYLQKPATENSLMPIVQALHRAVINTFHL